MFKEAWISYLIEMLPISRGEIFISKDIKICIPNSSDFLLLIFFLKNHTFTNLKFINDATAIDQLETEKRFQLVLILTSFFLHERVIIVSYPTQIQKLVYGQFSLTSFFSSSDWLEREIWDMFGVLFLGHTNLKRILTDYGFEGYPLRKDFPVVGYVELRYNENSKSLIYEPIELMQEIRDFTFQNPWKS